MRQSDAGDEICDLAQALAVELYEESVRLEIEEAEMLVAELLGE